VVNVAEQGEEREEVQVTRTEITTYPVPDKPFITVMVTYTAKDMPPATLFIPKQEWTPEEEAKRIREDLERRRKAKPEVIRL